MKKYTRKEMRQLMEVRGFSKATIKNYITHISNLAGYFNKAPHALSPDHIHEYQVFLVQHKQVSWSFFNQAVCAMRFFLIRALLKTTYFAQVILITTDNIRVYRSADTESISY